MTGAVEYGGWVGGEVLLLGSGGIWGRDGWDLGVQRRRGAARLFSRALGECHRAQHRALGDETHFQPRLHQLRYCENCAGQKGRCPLWDAPDCGFKTPDAISQRQQEATLASDCRAPD